MAQVEKGRFNVTTAFISAPDPDGFGRCSFLVEAPDDRASADSLKKVVEKSRFVDKVQVKGAHNGLLVDSVNFPLSWNTGDRAIMLRTEFFTAMKEEIRRHFETGADVVLYEMGYHHGVPTWRNLMKGYKVATLDDLEEVLAIYNANGWGTPEVLSFDLDAKTAVVALRDNFECYQRKGETLGGSNFVRGHLNGFFEVLFGGKVQVEETSCLARGDGRCVFSVAPGSGQAH